MDPQYETKAWKTKVELTKTRYSIIIDETIFTCLLLRFSSFIIIYANCSVNFLFKYTVQSKRSLCLIFSLDVTSLGIPSAPATDSQKRFIESNQTYIFY